MVFHGRTHCGKNQAMVMAGNGMISELSAVLT
jgi:hypothetical protein